MNGLAEVLLVVFLVLVILFLLDQLKEAGEREAAAGGERARGKWVEKEEEEEAYVEEELERIKREREGTEETGSGQTPGEEEG